MGACSSCLGRRDQHENGEDAGLLSDDPYPSHYGTRGHSIQRPAHQPDPESVRREREALDGICHAMSDNMIDVFAIQPQAHGPVSPRPETPNLDRKPTDKLSAEEVKMRTIKKGRGGPVFSTLGAGGNGWKAVQDAIG
ncbi:MAG: hypothetical protein MMC23_003549 [Stictis urceolatum]|nr:hypothetical protein [Stictis urceolata]